MEAHSVPHRWHLAERTGKVPASVRTPTQGRTGQDAPAAPPTPRPGRPPPPAPAAGISHFKDGRWGSRQALARGHRVSPAATAPAVVRALGDVPGYGRLAAGGSSATRGSRRSTGTLEGFFSAHGAALLCDGCSGAQLWATAFLGERRNRSPEQPHQVLPPATQEGPSVLVLAGAGSSLPVASAAHPAPPRRLICRLCILLTLLPVL